MSEFLRRLVNPKHFYALNLSTVHMLKHMLKFIEEIKNEIGEDIHSEYGRQTFEDFIKDMNRLHEVAAQAQAECVDFNCTMLSKKLSFEETLGRMNTLTALLKAALDEITKTYTYWGEKYMAIPGKANKEEACSIVPCGEHGDCGSCLNEKCFFSEYYIDKTGDDQ